ncbi:hypothetical protein [Exiguobacterium sp. AM39-5BH]|uniref:hypothetical protein n=1 Tax=Exiguobacterium sp. AM39-5BH TaxID=2292355 RepID=UPI001314EF32|nr:hypothetical protein [Exiguobacterium sp. AM39-5BH]
MVSNEWQTSVIGLGLVFGSGIGIIGSLLFGFELVYGIAVGAAFGYLIGLAVTLTRKT